MAAYTSTHRGARLSPLKARPVVNEIRGKHVDEALEILEMSKRRSAHLIKAVLNAAIDNADFQEASLDRLWITEAVINEGPTLKRFQPKDRGRAHPILKRTCHITIGLSEKD